MAALPGHPARANVLITLMSGRAPTAAESMQEAAAAPQTASSHSLMTSGDFPRRKNASAHRSPGLEIKILAARYQAPTKAPCGKTRRHWLRARHRPAVEGPPAFGHDMMPERSWQDAARVADWLGAHDI